MEILLVEDDSSHAIVIRHALEHHGHRVIVAHTAAEGKARLQQRRFDLLLVDYVLPDATGMSLLECQGGSEPTTPTIFLTATDSADVCLTAIRAGAKDYIVKGTDYQRTLPTRVAEVAGVRVPTAAPTDGIVAARLRGTAHAPLDRMLGVSPEMVMLKRLTLRAARSDLPILIEGPTGTGKELVARAIHDLGPRSDKPFIAVNCAAVPPALFESELFGHVKGAFTGAVGDRRGLVLGAHEGTLFLDEVGELVLESQAKLLRLLQDLEFRPVGSDAERRADTRVIAATNRPLRSAVVQRRFREDLYYRLAVVHIVVPPLAERRGDIPLLARAMVRSFAPRLGLVAAPEIADEAYAQLEAHGWPGNVRELENVVKRTLADLESRVIMAFRIGAADGAKFKAERERVEGLLLEHGGNLTQVARKLGISRPTLYKRLHQLGVNAEVYRRV